MRTFEIAGYGTVEELPLAGVLVLKPAPRSDERGWFLKNYQSTKLKEVGIFIVQTESYFSESHRDVLRGLHFQLPPYETSKIVFCLKGSVFDAVLDLRKNSPTYGASAQVLLSEGQGIYIPVGLAHGFLSLVDNTLLSYQCSAEYQPSHDTGILWNSAGIPWPCSSPIISERDRSFAPLEKFVSPFHI